VASNFHRLLKGWFARNLDPSLLLRSFRNCQTLGPVHTRGSCIFKVNCTY